MSVPGIIPTSLLELSADLKSMFEKSILCDFTIYVGNKAILCHRAILKARSRYFSYKIDQANSDGCTSIVINENEEVIDALLVYIYTGNLRFIESLKIPLLDLREAADKYGLEKFKKLLTKMIKSERKYDTAKTIDFMWEINVNDCKTSESNCPALEDFTLHGTDKWHLKMRPLCFGDKYVLGIYLIRQTTTTTESTVPITHIVNLEIHILDKAKKPRRSFLSDHIFKKDGESKMSEFISVCKLMENAKCLIPHGVLVLTGRISIFEEDRTEECKVFELKGVHERAVINELHALSYDMYKMLKAEEYCDSTIQISDTLFSKVHSYILYARSLIPPTAMSEMYAEGFGLIAWKSFINFLYTGQGRFLEDHMQAVYCALCKLKLNQAKIKYARILANHLTVSNVSGILSDASLFKDNELIHSAMLFIARNSEECMGCPVWKQFSCKYPIWVREIMRTSHFKKT